ncbi:peptidoglycan-binding domain-containing protein [Streptomyces mauvecolor]|uniref:Peptidoglycan-binding domain-containing protein n=1 Tax=Streptomyces mauvecolor TaxID=58345 RepID=A0ABV9ULB8_9ACTN
MDGRPGCACAERAAETLHAERVAEAAAAEDFDPLRIRPYVMLPNAGEEPPAAPEAPSEQTMRLGTVPAEEPPATVPEPPSPAGAPRNRRRLAALAIGAAAAVVIGTAAFASTLFAGDATPKRALPDVADTGVPYGGADTASAEAPSAVPSRTKKAAPGRSPSARPSPTPSASRAASPPPSKPAPKPSAPASGPPSNSPGDKPLAPPPSTTLRRGDSGPAVLELQERLGQLGLYTGTPDGVFGSRTERAVRDFQSYTGVDGDPAGVYGPATRRALESMTDRP